MAKPPKNVALDAHSTLDGLDFAGQGNLPPAIGCPFGAVGARLECGFLAVGLLVLRGEYC